MKVTQRMKLQYLFLVIKLMCLTAISSMTRFKMAVFKTTIYFLEMILLLWKMFFRSKLQFILTTTTDISLISQTGLSKHYYLLSLYYHKKKVWKKCRNRLAEFSTLPKHFSMFTLISMGWVSVGQSILRRSLPPWFNVQ